jgi:DNA-binding NarL/FixJ family response regulator
MDQITVLIADHQALFRGGLRMLSAQELAISVVGEAADDLQAIRLAEVLAD